MLDNDYLPVGLAPSALSLRRPLQFFCLGGKKFTLRVMPLCCYFCRAGKTWPFPKDAAREWRPGCLAGEAPTNGEPSAPLQHVRSVCLARALETAEGENRLHFKKTNIYDTSVFGAMEMERDPTASPRHTRGETVSAIRGRCARRGGGT